MDDTGWLTRVAAINQWRRGGERAPHKPLLLLYALTRLQRGNLEPLEYAEVEEDLDHLLEEFGPPRRTTPSYPFARLANDGLWVVRSDEGQGAPGDDRGRLRATHAVGELEPAFRSVLVQSPSLLARVARLLLDSNFEPSVQIDLLDELGLDLLNPETATPVLPGAEGQSRRDPNFRQLVLVAYEYRCAMCGLDPQIDAIPVGVDAAHVRWWAAGGPNDLSNGLCLCSLHHKLFDRGVLSLNPDRLILVSDRFRASGPLAKPLVLALSGKPLAEPQPGKPVIESRHTEWHRHQVFRGEPRAFASAG